MTVTTIAPDHIGHPWRRAFADAMIEIRPDINPDTADELSDSAFQRLSNLPPRHAAEIYSRSGTAWHFRPSSAA